jgi:hypothetical protein
MPDDKTLELPLLTIAQNVGLTAIAELCLRIFGLKRSWKMLLWVVPTIDDRREAKEIVRGQLSAMIKARKKKLILGKCLARSLVLWWQLRRRGLSANVVIGVRNKIDFRAHAWVEFEGVPLNAGKRVPEKYRSIARFQHPKDMT